MATVTRTFETISGTEKYTARYAPGDRGVVVTLSETSDEVADVDTGTTHWPDREPGDRDEVRAETEAALGVWIEALPDGHGWSDAGDGLVAATVALLDEQPTHRIDFRAGLNPSDDAPATSSDLVLLHDEGGAYTRDEWERCAGASWSHDAESGWLCEGQVTPGGANGAVTVTRLDD